MSTAHTLQATDDHPGPDECWCCGCQRDPAEMVHLESHPEVAICIRCAYSLKTRAWEIDDRARTGVGVRARNGLRSIRRQVVHKGLHQNTLLGRPLRWLGRKLP